MEDYATQVFIKLELNRYFDKLLTREDCICIMIDNTEVYIKDITIFNSTECVLFDNSMMSFGKNLESCVLVNSFNGERDDTEFIELISFIKENEQIALQKLFNDFFSFFQIYNLL